MARNKWFRTRNQSQKQKCVQGSASVPEIWDRQRLLAQLGGARPGYDCIQVPQLFCARLPLCKHQCMIRKLGCKMQPAETFISGCLLRSSLKRLPRCTCLLDFQLRRSLCHGFLRLSCLQLQLGSSLLLLQGAEALTLGFLLAAQGCLSLLPFDSLLPQMSTDRMAGSFLKRATSAIRLSKKRTVAVS